MKKLIDRRAKYEAEDKRPRTKLLQIRLSTAELKAVDNALPKNAKGQKMARGEWLRELLRRAVPGFPKEE